jgi:hypothetical protein
MILCYYIWVPLFSKLCSSYVLFHYIWIWTIYSNNLWLLYNLCISCFYLFWCKWFSSIFCYSVPWVPQFSKLIIALCFPIIYGHEHFIQLIYDSCKFMILICSINKDFEYLIDAAHHCILDLHNTCYERHHSNGNNGVIRHLASCLLFHFISKLVTLIPNLLLYFQACYFVVKLYYFIFISKLVLHFHFRACLLATSFSFPSMLSQFNSMFSYFLLDDY